MGVQLNVQASFVEQSFLYVNNFVSIRIRLEYEYEYLTVSLTVRKKTVATRHLPTAKITSDELCVSTCAPEEKKILLD